MKLLIDINIALLHPISPLYLSQTLSLIPNVALKIQNQSDACAL
jgi:hypothetical protein